MGEGHAEDLHTPSEDSALCRARVHRVFCTFCGVVGADKFVCFAKARFCPTPALRISVSSGNCAVDDRRREALQPLFPVRYRTGEDGTSRGSTTQSKPSRCATGGQQDVVEDRPCLGSSFGRLLLYLQ